MNKWGTKNTALLSAAILIGAAVVAGSSANASSVGTLVCVNSKTQVIELAKNNKCKSGYRALRIGAATAAQNSPVVSTSPSPSASNSPAPSPSASPVQNIYNPLNIYDATGRKLGALVEANPQGTWTALVGNYPVSFNPNDGLIIDNSNAGYYTSSNCTGTVYWPIAPNAPRFGSSDPLFINTLTPSRARASTVLLMVKDSSATALTMGGTMYRSDVGGACILDAEYSNNNYANSEMKWVPMRLVATVTDAVGPLSIRQ